MVLAFHPLTYAARAAFDPASRSRSVEYHRQPTVPTTAPRATAMRLASRAGRERMVSSQPDRSGGPAQWIGASPGPAPIVTGGDDNAGRICT